jgi:dihydroflavonol-4-reductase
MILVTGGTGLVGAHLLLHLLENETSVCAIYRNPKNIQKTKSLFEIYKKESLFDKISWIQADINNIPSLEIAFCNIDYVYHCAALISFDPKDEEKLRKTNIEGTANIVNFCLAKNIQKLCYVSSIAALGDLLDHEKIVTELTEWNPEKSHSDYAISKFGAEMEIWRAQQEGLQVVIVNPGVILGTGFENQGSSEIFAKVKKGLRFYTNGSTGFVAVWDLVNIMILLMKSNIDGERFTVVSENISYKNLLFEIANQYKVKKPTIYASPFMTNIASKTDWILSNIFLKKRKLSWDMSKTLHEISLISNEKIKKTFNYNFEKVNDTIQKVVALEVRK